MLSMINFVCSVVVLSSQNISLRILCCIRCVYWVLGRVGAFITAAVVLGSMIINENKYNEK